MADEGIPCCTGPCLICGADAPGHVEVLPPRQPWGDFRLPVGRFCSSHSFWEVIQTGRFMITVEATRD